MPAHSHVVSCAISASKIMTGGHASTYIVWSEIDLKILSGVPSKKLTFLFSQNGYGSLDNRIYPEVS